MKKINEILFFFYELYEEIKVWRIISKVVHENTDFLKENGLEHNKFGQIYTQIDIPQDINDNKMARDPFVLERIRSYDDILIELRLLDLITVDIEKINTRKDFGSSYLLVLEGPTEYISFNRIIKNILFWIIFITISYITYFNLIY